MHDVVFPIRIKCKSRSLAYNLNLLVKKSVWQRSLQETITKFCTVTWRCDENPIRANLRPSESARSRAPTQSRYSQCLGWLAKIMSTGRQVRCSFRRIVQWSNLRLAVGAACRSKRSLTRPVRPTTKGTSKQPTLTGPLSHAPAGLIRTRRRRRRSKMVTNLILGSLRRPAECHSRRLTHTKCIGN